MIKETKDYPAFKWLYQKMDRSRYELFKNTTDGDHENNMNIEDVLWYTERFKSENPGSLQDLDNYGKFSPEQELEDYLVDLLLIARTDGFVGRFSSNFDVLAYALMTANASPG
jgi:hypothetical protein